MIDEQFAYITPGPFAGGEPLELTITDRWEATATYQFNAPGGLQSKLDPQKRGLTPAIADFVEMAHRRPINVRFIEYMPFAVDSHHHDRFVSSAAIRRAIEKQHALTPVLAGENGDAVAREFSIPGFAGTIGFISPMTNHFCRGCNRLRLTAEGSIKSCLFYPAETNLRDAMRAGATDTELAGLIRRVVNKKSAAHPPVEMLPHLDQQTMIKIGG